jgi:hypothetical protein
MFLHHCCPDCRCSVAGGPRERPFQRDPSRMSAAYPPLPRRVFVHAYMQKLQLRRTRTYCRPEWRHVRQPVPLMRHYLAPSHAIYALLRQCFGTPVVPLLNTAQNPRNNLTPPPSCSPPTNLTEPFLTWQRPPPPRTASAPATVSTPAAGTARRRGRSAA